VVEIWLWSVAALWSSVGILALVLRYGDRQSKAGQ
jgi:hypothetical protein